MSHMNKSVSMIDDLENECYLKTDFNKAHRTEVKAKIEEFSSWFNSTARLCLLRCPSEDSEPFIYLLLNLKKKLKFAISEINRSSSSHRQSFVCKICDEVIQVEPWQNVWSRLQDHPHFEAIYHCLTDNPPAENGDSSASTSDDLSEDLSALDLQQSESEDDSSPGETNEVETGLNNFKFNFVVKYDLRVEEALYPEPILNACRKDGLSEYSVQRCGPLRGMCLLCPCPLIPGGRGSKISPYHVRNHVLGQRHLKCASLPEHINALKQYHDFWHGRDRVFQAHQVYFVPQVGVLNAIKCHLCVDFIAYDNVFKHIKDKVHQGRVLKLLHIAEGRLPEYYLTDMQVQMYDGLNNVKKEETKETKNKPAPPRCKFVKVVQDPNSVSLPPRYKAHLQFLKKTNDLVTCDVCKMAFMNTVTNLVGHIHSAQHAELSQTPVAKWAFYCEICNAHFKDEVHWEDHFSKGPNRHDHMSDGRKQKVAEYECQTCTVVIYGDELSLSRHISHGGKSGRAKELKLPFLVKKFMKSTRTIETEAKRLEEEATAVCNHQDKMQMCLQNLQEAVSGVYPNCKVYPFGSRISGLGNNRSDLDVFMDVGDMYLGKNHQDAASQEQFVKKVSKLLKAKEDFSHVCPIPSARTPIVKMKHIFTDLDCDVSFRHGLGFENTKFLRFCIDLQPVTQPFILVLKRWSEMCKLNEHITNYGLALMAVFFLQTEGHLLSVKTVRLYNPEKALVIDGWDTLNYTVSISKMKEYVKPYTSGIKKLLRDFFYYFSKFDYANQVVCPLLGTTVPKMWFNENPEMCLPPEMKSYVQRIQNDNGELFRGLSSFCIQDPFDLSHNLTKACQHGIITKLKAYCALTCEFLDALE